MTIDEARKKYCDGIKRCESDYIKDVEEFLQVNGLSGDVIRVKDGKRGIFRIDSRTHSVLFYPYTKAGRISLNSSGIVWADKILNDFKGAEK